MEEKQLVVISGSDVVRLYLYRVVICLNSHVKNLITNPNGRYRKHYIPGQRFSLFSLMHLANYRHSL
jgi:hypothetical protein